MSATVKVLATFKEAILLKPFQLLRCIRNDFSSMTENSVLQCRFQSKEQVKKSFGDRPGDYGGCSSVVSLFFAKKILDQNRLVCWSIVVTEKSTVVSPFIGAFPSDGISKATKNFNTRFFIESRNSCKLYRANSGDFLKLPTSHVW